MEGCHDGEYEGSKFFECKSKCGIFLKLEKLDFGISIRAAIQRKYLGTAEEGPLPEATPEPCTTSIPTPILVGEEKAKKYYAENLFDLDDLSLDESGVRLDISDDLQYLSQFTQIRRLSLCGNLFSKFSEIMHICMHLKNLEILNISANFFGLDNGNDDDDDGNLPALQHPLKELEMTDCDLSLTPEFGNILSRHFPHLKKFSTSGARIHLATAVQFPITLKSLCLQKSTYSIELSDSLNGFSKCKLESLDISGTPIKFPGTPVDACIFTNLIHLNISNTCQGDWQSIRWIFENLPNLKSLRVSENPFYNNTQFARSIIIVSLPKLEVLNGSPIRPSNRREMEKYCASLLTRGNEDACACIPLSVQKSLLEIFSSHSDTVIPNNPYNAVTRRTLVTVNIIAERITSMRLPLTCTVSEMKTMISRKISWPLKISEMAISARSGESTDDSDLIILSTASAVVDDIGIDDGWNVYVSVKGGVV